VYLLDKRPGQTSRRAASVVAEAWGQDKFGHGGTLDPEATGVLLVLMGRATRLSRFLTGHPKRYSFEVVLGRATDTDDATGEVVRTADVPDPPADPKRLQEVLSGFTGEFEQRPPSFSAVKVDGRRAFRAARRGERLNLPCKRVEARDWRVLDRGPDRLRLEVTVSSGTYVRSLARDIGEALDSAAHADSIRRLSVGGFGVEECSPRPDDGDALLPMARAMRDFPAVRLGGRNLVSVRHGMTIPAAAAGTTALLGPDGSLIAVGEGDGTAVRPVCVLRPL
jgi:tRNA pseudouridine55 synthase